MFLFIAVVIMLLKLLPSENYLFLIIAVIIHVIIFVVAIIIYTMVLFVFC